MEEFIEPLGGKKTTTFETNSIKKFAEVFLLSVIFDTSGFYGSYSLIY